jgi:imidazolonepropionase-like amidohydrolase
LAPPVPPGAEVQSFVKVAAGHVVLAHVRLIDGRGGPGRENVAIVLDGAVIAAILPGDGPLPEGATVLDLRGRTVIPGIVGMHDHMYYIARPDLDAAGRSAPPVVVPQMTFSSPRLYLASGVTTLRTTGSVEPYADLNVKRLIDEGRLPGPHMDVTGPYLEGAGTRFIQMHPLRDAEEARAMVAYWAGLGATSFKAYMNITRAELRASVEEAHKRGLKVTGHLCSVTYPEAVAVGIDNLEHGFYPNTELDPGKTPDVCPATAGRPTLLAMQAGAPKADELIHLLVDHGVALTSTLPVFEQSVPGHAPLQPRMLSLLTTEAREAYLYAHTFTDEASAESGAAARTQFAHELGLEKAFVAAGGLLLAGPDPTGNGGVLPGLGDQREIELLAEAGFSPADAIKIATFNGARFLGLSDKIGSVEAGKDADLVVVVGDPSHRIADIENVEIVFKDGVGFDAGKLMETVRGRDGQY